MAADKTGGYAEGGGMRFVVIGCLCGGALATVGCADGPGTPTGPSATAAVSGLAATAPGIDGTVAASASASPRSGDLRVAKECSGYTGGAGSFCSITSSNIHAIEVGSKIVYLQPDQIGTPSGSDVVLDPPGPGNNKAFGNCALDATGFGLCTFWGGTGKFTWFSATAHVSPPTAEDPVNWHWEGTYRFSPRD
jgi:hypothetical protein